ncbi:hypothetical protein [Solidesulfovibrio alcoholivorans]|uniref:hypothetical protein n=1 Tax=Solidesulfovibrio alcoholivorans TaxID=81406 RepID=UPI0012EBA345|nr:hypothetical protein [Solidesulfovibrio alcoholivorans]
MNPKEPRYTRGDLSNAVTNLRPLMLGMWIRRGVLDVNDTAPGRGVRRLYSFSEALVIDIMAYLTLQDVSSSQAAAVGKAASLEVEKIISKSGGLDYTKIDEAEVEDIVWSYNSIGKLDYKLVHRSALSGYTKDYFQVLNYISFAIRLYEALETVREIRARSGK